MNKEFKFGTWVPLKSTRPSKDVISLFWVKTFREKELSSEGPVVGMFFEENDTAKDTVFIAGRTFLRSNSFKNEDESVQVSHWMPSPPKPKD